MSKQYQAYAIRIVNGSLIGSGFCNYKNIAQAVTSAKRRIKEEQDIIEVLVYDTHLDIPILHPVFQAVRDGVVENKELYQKYLDFWKEKLEDIV